MTAKKLTTNQRIKQDKPIEIWKSRDGTWTWKIWRKYQKPHNEAKNPYARWYCGTRSPFTYGSYELGDEYVNVVKRSATQVYNEKDGWLIPEEIR